MEIKKEVVGYKKCPICGNIETFPIRTKETDSDLTDTQTLNIINYHFNRGTERADCEKCNVEVVFQVVGFNYKPEHELRLPEKN